MTTATTLPSQTAEFSRLEGAFARHETFHPRFGWLKKGFASASALPDLFVRSDAPALLGVGKNMVRAIRYWCLAYKVLYERPNPDRPRTRDAYPTELGKRLLSEDGWDPYLERSGSLWLLHWELMRPPCLAPAWYIAFHHFAQVEFSDSDLLAAVRAYRDRTPEFDGIVDGSLKKDVDCLLRMFAGPVNVLEVPEDGLDSPFVELDLIRRTPTSRRHYSFNVGPKRSLPDDIIVYACADFARMSGSGARILSLSSLAHSAGSPGRTFKLTESALFDAVDRYAQRSQLVQVDVAAGSRQFVLTKPADEVAESVLRRFYRRSEGWTV